MFEDILVYYNDHSSQQNSVLVQIIMEFPDELNAFLAAIKKSGKEPGWKFSTSTGN